jgi:hypothetical protein
VPFGQGESVRKCSCGKPIDSGDLNCLNCGKENALLRKALKPDHEIVGRWSDGVYVPNKYPKSGLISLALLSAILLFQVVFGFIYDEVVMTTRYLTYIRFHGATAWVMCGSLFFFAVSMITLVVDHFDKRPNEDMYRRISLHSQDIAWVLIAIAMIVD